MQKFQYFYSFDIKDKHIFVSFFIQALQISEADKFMKVREHDIIYDLQTSRFKPDHQGHTEGSLFMCSQKLAKYNNDIHIERGNTILCD